MTKTLEDQTARFEAAEKLMDGEDVAQDHVAAFRAFLTLAREGYADAQAMVAFYLCTDLEEDTFGEEAEAWDFDVEAAAWDMIAQENGSDQAGEIAEQAEEDADWLAAARARMGEIKAAYPAV
ncbi:hypothetical protein [Kordiimonas marina]|uniref:hypothetical protein n=1 Tax=Kordiimonas marina TaxID=2872312 RepID=UPI001FF51F79|nr:hypothetical protein [Kordiimonas marina]MCJ9428625.1 hypothetical protein [Kordiimonas marina]